VITIESNIKGVTGRLTRFMDGIEPAVTRAVSADAWHPVLKRDAETVLKGLADEETARFIPAFVSTVLTLGVSPRGFNTSMARADLLPVTTVSEAVSTLDRLQTQHYGDVSRKRQKPLQPSKEESRLLLDAELSILDWVINEKRIDGRDDGYSDEDIAERLGWILFSPRPTPAMLTARESLAGAINAYLTQESGDHGLSADVAALWLSAVLKSWRNMVVTHLPALVRQEIRNTWKQSGESLL
jgi:hypothetical protein